MAALSHHAAVLMTFSLLAGCGGDRSRAGADTDTTGTAAAHDTAASKVAAAPTAVPVVSALSIERGVVSARKPRRSWHPNPLAVVPVLD